MDLKNEEQFTLKQETMPLYFERKRRRIMVYTRSFVPFAPQHFHTHVEILYVIKGSCHIIIEGTDYTVSSNEAVIIFPNLVHGYEKTEDTQNHVILVSPEIFPEYSEMFTQKIPKNFLIKELDKSPRLLTYLNCVSQVYYEQKSNAELSMKCIMTAFFNELFNNMEMTDAEQNTGVTRALLSYCVAHYREQVTLNMLSKALYISPNYVSQIFNRKLHISLTDYINYLRINDAKLMLRETDYTVQHIGEECGFGSVRTFNHVFGKATGKSPSEYRRRHK